MTQASFGQYVSQIGKYPGAGAAGWVFKVNGALAAGRRRPGRRSKDGDQVLWYYATFSDTGGPPTLSLKAASANCYVVTSFDDAGKTAPAAGAQLQVDGRRFKAIGRRPGLRRAGTSALVRAFAVGAVRSNAVK